MWVPCCGVDGGCLSLVPFSKVRLPWFGSFRDCVFFLLFFLVAPLVCLAAVPAYPAIPILKQRTYCIVITRLHRFLFFVLYCILYGCLYYIAWFLFSFVTLGFTKTIYILRLLRGIMTKFENGRLGQWVFLWRHHLVYGWVLGWWVDLAIPVIEIS